MLDDARRKDWQLCVRCACFVALLLAVALSSACDQMADTAAEAPPSAFQPPPPDAKVYPTTVVASRELGTLKARVGEEEFAGVRCGVCHGIEVDDHVPARRAEDLEEFHTSMTFAHGELTCDACHSPDDRDMLRLADGQQIEFSRTMELCSQCHGDKRRDYDRGAHGGMIGHWDVYSGPRTRNHCVNCHDPHAPGFPAMQPWPPPPDAFPKNRRSHD